MTCRQSGITALVQVGGDSQDALFEQAAKPLLEKLRPVTQALKLA